MTEQTGNTQAVPQATEGVIGKIEASVKSAGAAVKAEAEKVLSEAAPLAKELAKAPAVVEKLAEQGYQIAHDELGKVLEAGETEAIHIYRKVETVAIEEFNKLKADVKDLQSRIDKFNSQGHGLRI